MDLSPPAAKELKLSSTKQIDDLTDADLEEIFKRLPPFDRLIASEVYRRWYGFSRKAWLDVTYLNLGPIPGKHIGVILGQCPNLHSVFALKKSFGLNELACPSRLSQLSTVKLFDCKFAVEGSSNVMNNVFTKIFSENLQQTSWNELVLHDICIEDRIDVPSRKHITNLDFFADNYRASLTRLQLSGFLVSHKYSYFPKNRTFLDYFLIALHRLQNLECMIFLSYMGNTAHRNARPVSHNNVLENIGDLKNLRELCIATLFIVPEQPCFGPLISSLPRLEVLFLTDVSGSTGNIMDGLKDLVVKNSTLRILVLSGSFYGPNWQPCQVDLPARNRFPNGFGSDPLPLLQIFVGKQASEKIRFAKSSPDACLVYPINEPMPQFLERADIAPIFDGVWIAEKIKETARNDGKLWNYESQDAANSVEYS